ncbi:MAG TPA: chloride channel protein [Polyangiaceae bacterium]|nr:chloride channel protein [Polyangiaceae bacterium]
MAAASPDLPPQRGLRARRLFPALLAAAAPIDLRIVGRTLLHAALVGAGAGVVGALFFAALELVERLLLGSLAGYEPLRAAGEKFLTGHQPGLFRPYLLLFLPALGALASGLLTTRFAPEAKGGGGDAMIEAFHHRAGVLRPRLLWVKSLASILTLGTGGAGGREGPTMQLGGVLGSVIGRALQVSARERRILMVAGVAAGISAVFRTPLGAALLATEVLYRDDFESDALIPALLASVISYSVFIYFFGESTLFSHARNFPFVPAHLLLYGGLSLLIALVATLFLKTLRAVQRYTERSFLPLWARPAMGGLALGVFATSLILLARTYLRLPDHGIGILGGGYGAAQLAITGAKWLPAGWAGVELLLLLCGAKIIATSLTVGSGGSAGDFAPSLAIGALFGGAFGRAAELLMEDGRIDPGAFALVGMGTFYGGIAHVPLSALVMVCELAGSYDLLVPMMLAQGIAFVALRGQSLYPAQLPAQRDSPAHATDALDVLKSMLVGDVMIAGRSFVSFHQGDPARELIRKAADAGWQDVFPVLDPAGKLVGMITSDVIRLIASDRELEPWTIAADAMQPPVAIGPQDDLRAATEKMLDNNLRAVPVTTAEGHIVGFLDEADIRKAYLDATSRKVIE